MMMPPFSSAIGIIIRLDKKRKKKIIIKNDDDDAAFLFRYWDYYPPRSRSRYGPVKRGDAETRRATLVTHEVVSEDVLVMAGMKDMLRLLAYYAR